MLNALCIYVNSCLSLYILLLLNYYYLLFIAEDFTLSNEPLKVIGMQWIHIFAARKRF